MQAEKKRAIPWLVHFVVVGAAGGALAFFAPFLLPILASTFGIFAALSTILFPVCRRHWALFLTNYLLAAVVAVVLFFRG